MQFNSYIFVLVFLPIIICCYYLGNKINTKLSKIVLIIGSGVFYLYAGIKLALIFSVSVIINYSFSVILSKAKKHQRLLVAIDIIFNVIALLYYKYFNFFVDNINQIFEKDIPMKKLFLPLGISFFTFQQIMYVVNVYWKKIDTNILDYLTYILYFPKIIMGPINDPVDFIDQINSDENKKIDWDKLAGGVKIFSFGLFKKLVLADTFAIAVNWGFENYKAMTSMDSFLVMLFYTFEIYFDFSGYSDMAVGVSAMLNIDLPMNFDSPYKANSIRDFWKRWHMTLTNFFTKYIYFPLGGSKKGNIRTYVNTMIIFLVSGVWHGANWTFILWGAIHGLLSIWDRITDKYQQKLHEVVRWSATFLVVNLLWLLFRAESISQWLHIMSTMFTFGDLNISNALIDCFKLPESVFIIDALHLSKISKLVRGFWLLVYILVAYGVCLIPENNYRKLDKNNELTMFLSSVAFVWAFLCLSSESTFVYFDF